MNAALLIDFGSTYSKLTAVDLDARRVIGTAQAYTTVETDISDGLRAGLNALEEQTGAIDYTVRLACSSAAGGLRMLACGLVPSLTAEAARLTALGAGAKVLKTYAYQLTEDDAAEIAAIAPDIFLLTGGTDGGNTEAILHNAETLAGIPGAFPVVVAGNRTAASSCRAILSSSPHPVLVTENVMPSFDGVNVLPAQKIIREVFLDRIIRAKGLSKVGELLDDIAMPTPAAVLSALELYADGTKQTRGAGEIMAIDLGGATTDIYSIASGAPGSSATLLRGLPEPYAKRTVEGDIGMRYSAEGVAAAYGEDTLAAVAGLTAARVRELLAVIGADKSVLPGDDRDDLSKLDFALAALAVRAGLSRHAGTIRQVFTPVGEVFQQTGKDLTRVGRLVCTGGAMIRSARLQEIVSTALAGISPESLVPRRARVVADSRYILSAAGLLSKDYPETALELMKNMLGKDC